MYKRKLCIIISICLGLFAFKSFAQNKKIIIGKKLIKKDKETSEIRALAIDLTKQSITEDDKARVIFKWIVTHIPYDYELRFNKQLQQRIYTSEQNVVDHVLKRRKAMCGGYAFLFKALCREVGIETKVVHGYSKKYGIPQSTQIDHTWNAIKSNNSWKLLDITYAIGAKNSGNDPFLWYDCAPSQFIETHYPQEVKWSLLESVKPRSFYTVP